MKTALRYSLIIALYFWYISEPRDTSAFSGMLERKPPKTQCTMELQDNNGEFVCVSPKELTTEGNQ